MTEKYYKKAVELHEAIEQLLEVKKKIENHDFKVRINYLGQLNLLGYIFESLEKKYTSELEQDLTKLVDENLEKLQKKWEKM